MLLHENPTLILIKIFRSLGIEIAILKNEYFHYLRNCYIQTRSHIHLFFLFSVHEIVSYSNQTFQSLKNAH